jgi:hypothetical protein
MAADSVRLLTAVSVVTAMLAMLPRTAPAAEKVSDGHPRVPVLRRARVASEPGRGLRVGVLGMAAWDGSRRLRAVGVKWDRVDVGDGRNIDLVRWAISRGVKVQVLYNPGLAGRSPAQCGADVRALAHEILPLGLFEIEFGNEVYFNGSTPQSYAAQYAAAHAAIAGMGVTLIADSFGDYQRPDGSWSQDARGGGWIHDFIRALPQHGREIDAFSIHPYGPVNHFGSMDGGWPSVRRFHHLAVANGVNVPWYITEVGQNLGHSTTSPPVDPHTQAADVTRYLSDTMFKFPWVTYIGLYALRDDDSGRWGLLNSNFTPRPAFRALVRFMLRHR